MGLRDRIPDEALDMTQSELKESDEFDWDEEARTEQEFREHIGELHEMFEVYSAGILLARMFDDEHLTLGEYLELADYLEEYERDLSVDVL